MNNHLDDATLAAYALNEVDDAQRAIVEAALEANPDARQAVDAFRAAAQLAAEAYQQEPRLALTDGQRQSLLARVGTSEAGQIAANMARDRKARWSRWAKRIGVAAAACLVIAVGVATFLARPREAVRVVEGNSPSAAYFYEGLGQPPDAERQVEQRTRLNVRGDYDVNNFHATSPDHAFNGVWAFPGAPSAVPGAGPAPMPLAFGRGVIGAGAPGPSGGVAGYGGGMGGIRGGGMGGFAPGADPRGLPGTGGFGYGAAGGMGGGVPAGSAVDIGGGSGDKIASAHATSPQIDAAVRAESATVPEGQPPDRYLIRNASLELEAEDAEAASQQLQEAVRAAGGYVSGLDKRVDGLGRPSVNLTLRVPADKLDGSLDAIRTLGRIIHEQVTTEDVTEEYVDLDARLRNLKKAEERLLDHLSKAILIDSTLKVEQELTRVREQIERFEGRLHFLGNRVRYSTIQIVISQKPKAEQMAPVATFSSGRVFTQAVRSLAEFGQTLWTKAIWLVVWAPVWAVGVAVLAIVYRRIRRRVRARR